MNMTLQLMSTMVDLHSLFLLLQRLITGLMVLELTLIAQQDPEIASIKVLRTSYHRRLRYQTMSSTSLHPLKDWDFLLLQVLSFKVLMVSLQGYISIHGVRHREQRQVNRWRGIEDNSLFPLPVEHQLHGWHLAVERMIISKFLPLDCRW
jgi:hypothetical protein